MSAVPWTVTALTHAIRLRDGHPIHIVPGDRLRLEMTGSQVLAQWLGEWYVVPPRLWSNLAPLPPATAERRVS